MKKTLITILVTVLVCGSVFGTTLAFLMDKTETITNTFTYGNINITLTESEGTANGNVRTFKMMPGATIDKNPTVTVKAGSEACWLFVEIKESTNFDDFMTYEMAAGWTALTGVTGVYYREVAGISADGTDATYSVLKDNQVKVIDTVTKTNFTSLTDATLPTLSFTAYAVQKDTNVSTAAAAWSIATTGNLPTT